MGCIASRIEEEERVRICRERRKLMKQMVGFRAEFADSLLSYLRSLRNTGVTLGQFTESESLEAAESSSASYGLLGLPSSPLLPLPPSPPPPPFSPDSRKSNTDTSNNNPKEEEENQGAQEESITVDQGDRRRSNTPPPPPESSSSSWNCYWDPFEPNSEIVESAMQEESWAETNTYFDDDDDDNKEDEHGEEAAAPSANILVDDNSSAVSSHTKDTADMAMVQWRCKKTLEAIVRDLDDYFLKASAGGKEIALLMDISRGDTSLPHSFRERNRSDSAKVFSALSWSSRSSRSFQLTKDAAEVCSTSEPCKPGAHCITLEKLYAAEQKLYKEVKEEEITKLEFQKKSMLLVKLEQENHDWNKTEKIRSSVEELESELRKLRQSISGGCSYISELITVELYPQLIALVSGLKNTWRTMYECHQLQYHISQQLNHLTDNQGLESSTTDFHLKATAQLEAEITSWYKGFCKLVKSQQEYVTTLVRWIQLTSCLVDNGQQPSGRSPSAVHKLCEEWLLSFDKLPDKVASEAIKGFLSAIQSIMQQQSEELSLQRKSDKLERRLQKELISVAEMQKRLDWSIPEGGDQTPNLSPKHP
ncbi:Protein ALTERED PHOSPHATE STARVATION RESPONSE 1, partial [Linum perenne]